jgi:protein-S-isoprenylcysteine O-methyltransferase Ste14
MKSLWLLFKNLLFTLCVPGAVVGWIPFHWFERHAHWIDPWLWAQWTGAALFAVGALAFLYCQWYFFARGQGTPAPIDPPKKMVRRGPYKWVRNPMYLAVLALVGSEALFFGSWHIGVYFICLACLLHLFVVAYEEDALRVRFGALYEDYKREVPRWVPRRPRPPVVTASPFPARR